MNQSIYEKVLKVGERMIQSGERKIQNYSSKGKINNKQRKNQSTNQGCDKKQNLLRFHKQEQSALSKLLIVPVNITVYSTCIIF